MAIFLPNLVITWAKGRPDVVVFVPNRLQTASS